MTKLWDIGKVVGIHVNKHGQSYCYSIQQSSDLEGERRTLILCRWGKDRKTIKGFQRLFLQIQEIQKTPEIKLSVQFTTFSFSIFESYIKFCM